MELGQVPSALDADEGEVELHFQFEGPSAGHAGGDAAGGGDGVVEGLAGHG